MQKSVDCTPPFPKPLFSLEFYTSIRRKAPKMAHSYQGGSCLKLPPMDPPMLRGTFA